MGGSSSNPFHGIRNWDVTKGGNAVFFLLSSKVAAGLPFHGGRIAEKEIN